MKKLYRLLLKERFHNVPLIKSLLLLMAITQFHVLSAQKDSTQHTIGFESTFIVGYTGFNFFIGPVYSLKDHQLYAGPKINLNEFYLPNNSPLDFNAGYRYFYLSSTKFSSFINLDYQLSLYKLYDPYDRYPNKKKNNVQELTFALGSQYKFSPKLNVGLSFGFGLYREKFHSIPSNKTDKFHGYTIGTRVSLQYKIFDL